MSSVSAEQVREGQRKDAETRAWLERHDREIAWLKERYRLATGRNGGKA